MMLKWWHKFWKSDDSVDIEKILKENQDYKESSTPSSIMDTFTQHDIRFIEHQLRLRRVALREAIRRDEPKPEKANMVGCWKKNLLKLETIIPKFSSEVDTLDGMDDIHWDNSRK